MRKEPRYHIYEDLESVEYCDEPPWRCYKLMGEGETWSEVHSSLQIEELGQKGETIDVYPIAMASHEVMEAGYKKLSDLMFNEVKQVKYLLHPDTKRLTIRAKHDISQAQSTNLYDVLNYLFHQNYGPVGELEIYAVKMYLDKIQGKGQ